MITHYVNAACHNDRHPDPRTRRSGEDRQRQIVETLLELVEELGVKAVSAQAIADRIGVSQPAIFRHFATKEALWLAVNRLAR